MIVNQLILSFKLKLDKIDSQAYPDILEPEIRFWLDEAADRFVKQRYERNNIKGKGFEETQKRTDDLRSAVRTETINASASSNYTGFGFDIPLSTDYRYLIKIQVETDGLDCNNNQELNWVTPFQTQQDDIYALEKDPFNKTGEDRPLFIIEEGNIVVFTDQTFSITRARISYIRTFDKLQPGLPRTSTPYQTGTTEYEELAEDTHAEIVDIAVKMALENIESQRYQTNVNEITGTE